MAANLIEIIAIDGQTVFDFPFTYNIGANDLFSYLNGQILYVGEQYTETSPTSITLLGFSAQAGDRFLFRIPPGSFIGMSAPTAFSFAPPLPRPTQAPILTFS